MSENPPRKRFTKEEIKANPKIGMAEWRHGDPLVNSINPENEKVRKEVEKSFSPTEFRRKANSALDDLKADIYSRKLSPTDLSKAWQPVRLAHDRITASLAEYRQATKADRAKIVETLKKDYALLQGGLTDDVHEAFQEKARSSPREQGSIAPELPENFEKKYDAAVSAEAHEFKERELDTIANIRAQITHLDQTSKNGSGGRKKNNEEQILRLEEELRRHERLAKGELPTPPSEAKKEMKEENKDIDYGALLDKEFPRITKTDETAEQPTPVSDQTPAEAVVSQRAKMESAVSQIQDITSVDRRSAEAEERGMQEAYGSMQAKEVEYLTLLKQISRDGSEGISAFEKVQRTVELHKLKEAYNEERIAYGNALTKAESERLDTLNLDPARKAEMLGNFNRLTRFNEIIKPTFDLETEARLSGLSEQQKKGFSLGLEWFARGNQWLERKTSPTAAKWIRAGASTVFVTGLFAGGGAVVGVSLVGLSASALAMKFGRTVAGVVLSDSILAQGLGKAYGWFAGREVNAKRTELADMGRADGELTAEGLADSDRARARLGEEVLSDEQRIARNKLRLKMASAFALGAGSGAILSSELMGNAVHAVADHTHVFGGHHPDSALSRQPGSAALGKGNVTELAQLESVRAEHGMGGIRMLGELKNNMGDMHSPAMDVLRGGDPTKLAIELGLYHPGAAGGLENLEVPKGSTMAFANNGELVLTLKGGQSLSLLDSSGNVIPHTPDEIGRFIGLNHAAESAATPTETAHNTDHSSDIYNERELNRIHAAEAQQGTSARAAVPPTEPVPRTPRYAPEAAPRPSDQYVPADRQPAAPSVREAVPTPAGRPEVIPPETPRGASIPHETSAPPSAPRSEVPQPESFTSSGTEVPFGRITLPPSETALVADHAGRLTMAGADADQQFIDAQKYVIGLKDPNATVLIHDYVTDNLGTRVPIVSLVQYDAARGTARVIIGDPTQYPVPSPDESVRLVRTFSKSS